MESRTHLDVSSHENSSTPANGPKVVIPVITKFDIDPIAMTIASLTCHIAKRQIGNTIKTKTICKPLAVGFKLLQVCNITLL